MQGPNLCYDCSEFHAARLTGLPCCPLSAPLTKSLNYNAKNQDSSPWIEQTGLATSTNLVHWQCCPANPVLKVGPPGAFDDVFASDPCVLRLDDGCVMFYFGNCSDGHARDSAAFSPDLLTW